MSTVSAVDLTFLAPGHVWLKEGGSQHIVLFLSNEALPEKVQAKFPPQVVYMNEEGNVFTQSIEMFCSDRKFHNVDADVEAKLNSLIAFNGDETLSLLDDLLIDEEDTEESIQGTYVGDGEQDVTIDNADEVLTFGADMAAEIVSEAVRSASEERVVAANVNPVVIFQGVEEPNVNASLEIEKTIIGYQQAPEISNSLIYHILSFDAVQLSALGLDKDTLAQAFVPEGNQSFLGSFFVPMINETINWDYYCGIFASLINGAPTYNVYLASSDRSAEEASNQEASTTAVVNETPVVVEAAPAVAVAQQPPAIEGVVVVQTSSGDKQG